MRRTSGIHVCGPIGGVIWLAGPESGNRCRDCSGCLDPFLARNHYLETSAPGKDLRAAAKSVIEISRPDSELAVEYGMRLEAQDARPGIWALGPWDPEASSY